MKVLFTCGGTAGHINPAVALAGMFQHLVLRGAAAVDGIGGKG